MRSSEIVRAVALGSFVLAAACSKNQSTTAPSTTTTSPTTQVFTSMLYPRGVATESFVAAQSGTIGVTLTSVGPTPSTVLGLGLGLPNPNAPGCSLTSTVSTAPGSTAQITAA